METLHDLGVPVLLVMTKVPSVDGRNTPTAVAFHQAIVQMDAAGGGWPGVAGDGAGRRLRRLARARPAELVEQTRLVAPSSGSRPPWSPPSASDAEAKAREAKKVVAAAAAAAGAAAATPIPFADAAVLVPIQLRMMSRIALLHNVPMDRATLLALGSVAATPAPAGRWPRSGQARPRRRHRGRRGDRERAWRPR
jgi:hypothetical protein